MAEPDITPLQTALAEQATGELHDPVTDEPRITGFPRSAVDLRHIKQLLDWGQ